MTTILIYHQIIMLINHFQFRLFNIGLIIFKNIRKESL